MRFMLTLLPLLLIAATAWPDQAGLAPPTCAVELRSYGFGLIPFDGNFTRFHGLMHYDPADPAECQVELEIDAESLTMSNQTIRDRITGPAMMDVARFPAISFRGTCRGNTMTGDLTMHGETHAVSFEVERATRSITTTGHIRRADWGITGSPLTGGPTIRIKVVVPNPFTGAPT